MAIKTVIARKSDGTVVDVLEAGTRIAGLITTLMYADVEYGQETNIDQIDGWNDAMASKVRNERDALLTTCDWTQMPDSPLDELAKAAWANYRQELRNVPELSGFPNDFTWPTAP